MSGEAGDGAAHQGGAARVVEGADGQCDVIARRLGFAVFGLVAAGLPEITLAITHLRDVLGDPAYESLARKGETMTTTAMVTYAYDQIDHARAELNAVSK